MLNLTVPAFIYGTLFACIYGFVLHLWKGGGAGRLILYLMLSWVGFWVGHFTGSIFSWSFFAIGPVFFGTATIGSLLFLGIGYWLSLVENK